MTARVLEFKPPCRLDHETMRKEAIDKGLTPPIDCHECGVCLVVR